MKKLLVALLAVAGLVMLNADAYYRRCGYRGCGYKSACAVQECAPRCAAPCAAPCAVPCKVDNVIEQPCPAVPCCVRYVRVEEPALITKHISYSAECPSNCTEENKAAGMMNAGDVWEEQTGQLKTKNY